MDIFFYLYKTKNPKIGTLKYGVREGSHIITRKSVGYMIPYALWSEEKQRVKTSKTLDYQEINHKLDELAKAFINAPVSFTQNEDRDFFDFAKERIEQQENVDTQKKYKTVLIDYKKFLLSEAKISSFPIKEFRNPIWIENYKNYLKSKSIGYRGKRKKNYVIYNYVKVLRSFVSSWNRRFSIQNPIPTHYFCNDAKGLEKVPHRAISSDELKIFKEHEPTSNSQLNSKYLFLFQLYGGGMRVSDAFLMRFSAFRDGGIYYIMKKNKHQNYINFDFLIAQTLKYFYHEEYEQAKQEATLNKLRIPADDMFKYFSRLSFTEPNSITLDEISNLLSVSAKIKNRKNADLLEFLQRLKREMEDFLADCYFRILSKKGNQFIFPFLLDEDFKNISSSEPHQINETQSQL
jgi:hypothetical protein